MNKRYFYRRNLPHLHYNEGTYFITYRLNDSIPVHLLKELREEYDSDLKKSDDIDETKRRLFIKYDKLLDQNTSDKINLTQPELSSIIKNTLHYPDKSQYNLICYCIMPNHVHVIFELLKDNNGIIKILQSMKRISARDINRVMKMTGPFWQAESYDRLVRDDKELFYTINYVINNPVNAGLVSDPNEWRDTYYDPAICGIPEAPPENRKPE